MMLKCGLEVVHFISVRLRILLGENSFFFSIRVDRLIFGATVGYFFFVFNFLKLLIGGANTFACSIWAFSSDYSFCSAICAIFLRTACSIFLFRMSYLAWAFSDRRSAKYLTGLKGSGFWLVPILKASLFCKKSWLRRGTSRQFLPPKENDLRNLGESLRTSV